MIFNQQKVTEDFLPRLKELAPESGSYLNEVSNCEVFVYIYANVIQADFQEKDWQTAFYGSNYPELSKIKAKYDPNDLFYCLTAVGSERYYISEGGRLCRMP